MVLREERAATNVKRAMNDAGVQFQLKGLERMVEGYVATFQRMVTHVESQIDESVLPALQALIQKVQAGIRRDDMTISHCIARLSHCTAALPERLLPSDTSISMASLLGEFRPWYRARRWRTR